MVVKVKIIQKDLFLIQKIGRISPIYSPPLKHWKCLLAAKNSDITEPVKLLLLMMMMIFTASGSKTSIFFKRMRDESDVKKISIKMWVDQEANENEAGFYQRKFGFLLTFFLVRDFRPKNAFFQHRRMDEEEEIRRRDWGLMTTAATTTSLLSVTSFTSFPTKLGSAHHIDRIAKILY